MAKWTGFKGNFTLVAVADTTDITDGGFLALQGGSSTQRINVYEVKLGGLATSSAPTAAVLARDSQVATGSLTGALMSADDPATAALAAPPAVYAESAVRSSPPPGSQGGARGLHSNWSLGRPGIC